MAGGFDHDAVLPRRRAAVHHGGAGTTHTVLRAGLPAAVAHVFADQSLWGWRVQQVGAGVMLPYRALDAARLERSLRPLLDDRARARAQAVGAAMADDRPAELITETIESGRVSLGR